MDKQKIATKIRFKIQQINELVRILHEIDSLIEVQITGGNGVMYQVKVTEEIV